MTIQKYTLYFLILIGFTACEPYVEEKIDIGGPPNPSFEIVQGATPNDFTLRNTTPETFLTQWDLGDNGGKQEGEVVDIALPFAGTYDVSMTTFNKGGSATVTQSVNVTQDNPNACFGNLELLTDCSSKTWTLLQDEAAMIVGPSLTDVWWNNSAGDVTSRSCLFNDRYIFTADGVFEYDNQGDFWADDDGGGNIYPPNLDLTVGCHQSEDWPADFDAWDSGVHTFEITQNTLKVIGNGAYIGLYKVGDQQETLVPEDEITYTIESITENRLELSMFYGVGYWRFVFVPLN